MRLRDCFNRGGLYAKGAKRFNQENIAGRAAGTGFSPRFPPVENGRRIFPQCGNIFSIVWKNREKVFHCVENLGDPFFLTGESRKGLRAAGKKKGFSGRTGVA